MESKICSRCGVRLLLKHFYFINSRKQHSARCIECCKEVQREYRVKRSIQRAALKDSHA